MSLDLDLDKEVNCPELILGEISCEGKVFLCGRGEGKNIPKGIIVKGNYKRACIITEFQMRTDGEYKICVDIDKMKSCDYCRSLAATK